MVKVSVVVAVYNAEKYLRQAIESIQNQTLEEIEILLVDDGSEDSSLDILWEYAARDIRIKVLINKEHSDGAASARNLGISKAVGQYVSILDSDDFFEPDMLEKMWGMAMETGSEVVICDGFRHDDINSVDLERNSILVRDKLPRGKVSFRPEENADNLFVMTIGAAWNVLFSRGLVQREALRFKSFHHADDFEFVYLGFASARQISVLPQRLVHYRVNHIGSQASQVDEWPDTAWASMESFRNCLLKRGKYEIYRIAFARVAMRYFQFYLDSMRSIQSFRKLFLDLKGKYLEALDLAHMTEAEIGDRGLYALCDLICTGSPEDYLFCKLKNCPPFDSTVAWMQNVPQNSVVVLYGADRVGVDVFHNILSGRNYRLCAWVDRQWRELGYPIQNPEKIKDLDFNYIVVTFLSEKTFHSIRESLMEMGVGKEKIIWIMEKK